jgi:type II secretory ATPase GspE/PulE/Tfp pilus assembly ATPase PilB-like protein
MLKILEAPTLPIQALQRFSVVGCADPIYAGTHPILAIDNQIKVTAPSVTSEGNWRIDLALQQPGSYHLSIMLDSDRVDLAIQVVAAKPQSNVPTLEQLVREAYEKGFSDLHLGVGKVPCFRNRGEIEVSSYPKTDEATFFSWVREVLTETEMKQFQEIFDFDGSASYEFARVRLNLFNTLKGAAMVLRLIPLKIPTIASLGLPKVFQHICHYQKGLVLVTGPTGSGKSTTLAAMVDYINKHMPKHIITIEDPIEFVHQDHKSVLSQREVGIHTLDFNRGLKAALREDPDVILMGEMRAPHRQHCPPSCSNRTSGIWYAPYQQCRQNYRSDLEYV